MFHSTVGRRNTSLQDQEDHVSQPIHVLTPSKAANDFAFVGSTFSMSSVVNETAEGAAALAALLAQTLGGWELLV
jgi:hypothetical protein